MSAEARAYDTTLVRWAGLAALGEALLYLAGFALQGTLLNPAEASGWSPAQKLAFAVSHKVHAQVFTVMVYLLGGILLVALTAGLHERLKAQASTLMGLATPFGFIWAGLVMASGMITCVGLDAVATLHAQDPAQALSLWRALGAVQNGLGGGMEGVGGVWVLLLSLAAHRQAGIPRLVNGLGFVVGTIGLLTFIPALGELVSLFGLAQIPWFIGIGLSLRRATR